MASSATSRESAIALATSVAGLVPLSVLTSKNSGPFVPELIAAALICTAGVALGTVAWSRILGRLAVIVGAIGLSVAIVLLGVHAWHVRPRLSAIPARPPIWIGPVEGTDDDSIGDGVSRLLPATDACPSVTPFDESHCNEPWQGVDEAEARRRGTQAARNDVGDGLLALTITGPLSFEGRDLAFADVLARYGIARRIYGDALPSEALAYREGYDEEMAKAISVRYGSDFRSRVESEVAALLGMGERSPENAR